MAMNAHEEYQLYLRDKRAWARAIAPRRAQLLAGVTCPEAKRRLWDAFGEVSRLIYGPSYALNPREFRDSWPDAWLLEAQNRLIGEYNKNMMCVMQ